MPSAMRWSRPAPETSSAIPRRSASSTAPAARCWSAPASPRWRCVRGTRRPFIPPSEPEPVSDGGSPLHADAHIALEDAALVAAQIGRVVAGGEEADLVGHFGDHAAAELEGGRPALGRDVGGVEIDMAGAAEIVPDVGFEVGLQRHAVDGGLALQPRTQPAADAVV